MGDHRTARPQRAAGLGALLGAFTLASVPMLGRQVVQTWPGGGPTGIETALLTVTLAGATLLMCWVSVVLTLAVLELLRGTAVGHGGVGHGGVGHGGAAMSSRRRWPSTALPTTFGTVRRVSVILLALTAVPAHAAPAGPPEPSWNGASQDPIASSVTTPDPEPAREQPRLPDGSPVPLPGWTPTPASASVKPTATIGLVSAAPREAPTEHVVVRAGDTLWSLTARHLGQQATVQDIAEEWPRWYAANREVIGPDPDRILPGQELRIPGPDAPAAQTDPADEEARR
ncbi:LysM peptidoglycan-binding domain-containing protein [Ornithinimicrobium pratense]|uniref:LysM peptidoglycan-binding domain-containing protein n=1 Tax=Ornithinimicrobium pratense TaxID=2593973 RepID=A0A5J6V4L4_9MICO|nr:LysM peptidoglycan-binding domain-containing protein [Ornithinimicrobium pratense]QFG68022.1 LysM peptidoglycan-binding domain-containing protein [Ornithinimicrobium pratense]